MRRTPLIAAWLSLVWERAVPVLWPGLAWLGVFAILALFGVWELIGDPGRALYALASLGGAVWLTRGPARSFVWPDAESLARRVEEDSGIAARPHEALIDSPPGDDPVELKIWSEHQRRMAERLKLAHARRPKAAWARMDRWALRGTIALMLAVSWLLAGPSASDRLGEAFSLSPIVAGGEPVSLDAWIDPPAYTGRAPIFLTEGETQAEIPAGSIFITRIAGSRRTPNLTRRDSAGSERAEPTEIGDNVWEARLPVTEDANLRLRAGGTRQTWTLTTIADLAPEVRILAVPDATASGELDIQFSVTDDYGATGYGLEFRPENDSSAAWEVLDITPGGVATLDPDNGIRALLETAQHRLAGTRVNIRVVAEDAGGNIGRSPELGITLPRRVFLDALARAVVEQRAVMLNVDGIYAPLEDRDVIYADQMLPGPNYLYDEPQRRIERAPEDIQGVARSLVAITDAPEYFFDDQVVYLGLREIVHRLQRARDRDALGEIEDDLWAIALRAELGSLADAEAALRAAERALMEALARGADETELAALFEAFQEAMDNYMAALAREAVEDGNLAEGGGQTFDQSGLQEMLDALREAAELGDTADAREALAALSELLRNMQMQASMGGEGGDQDDPISEAIARALEELGDVIGEQRELQDQTFGLTQDQQGAGQPQPQGNGQPGQQDGNTPQTLAENQEGGASRTQALAEMQAELADRLRRSQEALPNGGEDALSNAAQAMEDAQQALQDGNADGALAAQEEALADLRAGAEEMARDLLERMQEGQDGEGRGEEEDPLGRPSDGAFADGSGVEIPDEMTRARAREILDELRRRSAQTGRSQEELDYIERLLDRF
jgi:hypothetical protein